MSLVKKYVKWQVGMKKQRDEVIKKYYSSKAKALKKKKK